MILTTARLLMRTSEKSPAKRPFLRKEVVNLIHDERNLHLQQRFYKYCLYIP
jgi:hypothetical protein